MSVDVIAIDGPSASGKSTVARKVAARLGRIYVDSGALYRSIAWKAMTAGCDTGRAEAVVAALGAMKVECDVVGSAVRYRVDGYEPAAEIRTEQVSGHVSLVAVVPEVRAAVTDWLRGMTRFGALVMEGRDIGTVVFPDAQAKFYLDASPEERARRRSAELVAPGESADVSTVKNSLEDRDRRDRGRKTAPLKVAGDAQVIDTTGLGIDDVVAEILSRLRNSKI
jgi:cytidylate kinase